MTGENGQTWWFTWIDEIDVMDILVSVELHHRTIAQLSMVSNRIVGIENDSDDNCSLFSRFGKRQLHVLRYQHKIRLWVCANATGGDSSARIKSEAISGAGKLNMKRDDTVQEIWLHGVNGCVLLSDFFSGLMDEHWRDVLDLAEALIRCRREEDFRGLGTPQETAWISKLPLSDAVLNIFVYDARTSSSRHWGQIHSPVALFRAADPSWHLTSEQSPFTSSSEGEVADCRTSISA